MKVKYSSSETTKFLALLIFHCSELMRGVAPDSHSEMVGLNECIQMTSKQLIAELGIDDSIGYPREQFVRILEEKASRYGVTTQLAWAIEHARGVRRED
ncbi:MAG: hypothetical protein R3F21_20200 [Myxococcota bacterium]